MLISLEVTIILTLRSMKTASSRWKYEKHKKITNNSIEELYFLRLYKYTGILVIIAFINQMVYVIVSASLEVLHDDSRND